VLVQGATLMDALSWRPELVSRLMIASRETGELVASIDVGHSYCLHLVNAFDRGEHLVVDVLEFEKPLYPEYQVIPDLFTDTFLGHPVRFVVDPGAAAIVERRDIEYTCSPDFPAHDPDAIGRPYDHFWMLGISDAGRPGRKFFDHVVRVAWTSEQVEVYEASSSCYFGGEPCFVPDPEAPGDRGVVVCQQFDAARIVSSFLVFDAFQLAKGPMATITLASPIPLLFHSAFQAASS
jgi:carotenoid cleavage dioxygenase-like enzyme